MKNEQYYQTKAVSNSILNLFEESPQKFLDYWNTGVLEKKDSSGFKLGSAFDCLITDAEDFNQQYFVLTDTELPTGRTKEFLDTYSKGFFVESDIPHLRKQMGLRASVDTLKESIQKYSSYLGLVCEALGPELLSKDEWVTLQKMRDNLLSNPEAKYLIENTTEFQKEVYREHPFGFPMKGLIDGYFEGTVWDLKTTHLSAGEFLSSYRKYNYGRQLTFYVLLLNKKYCDKKFVVCSTKYPYDCKVYMIGNQEVRYYSDQIQYLLSGIAKLLGGRFQTNDNCYELEELTNYA